MRPLLSFAGFIITFERPDVLASTINRVFSQTLPPTKLWIIDNSRTDLTQQMVGSWNDSRLIYYRTGANLGPAGGAKIGLALASAEGYEWIFWGDDDDPPPHADTFEKLLEVRFLPDNSIGQVGMVGQYFNFRTGMIRRVTDEELNANEWIKIDTIAGGQCKIVKSAVFVKGAMPTEKLFFGFEELDFDIQLKSLGFTSWVRTDLFLLQRKEPLRYEHIRSKLLDKSSLWRQYYSLRNLLHIFRKNSMYLAFMILILRRSAKSIYSFRFGWSYGSSLCKYTLLGIRDWLTNRFGYKEF